MALHTVYHFTTYVKYIGKPLYKVSRKYISKSKLVALEFSALPLTITLGSILAVITNNYSASLYFAIGHQTVMPIYLYSKHKWNKRKRKNKREISLESIIE